MIKKLINNKNKKNFKKKLNNQFQFQGIFKIIINIKQNN